MHKFKDLTGERINSLTVLKLHHSEKRNASYGGYEHYWDCLCDCGNTKIIRHSQLITKKVMSCGCFRKEKLNKPKEDITGKVYGRLTVIKWSGNGKWVCRCSCGKTTTVKTAKLNNGTTKSCGCYNKDVLEAKKTYLKGNKFGKLTVIEDLHGSRCLCKCECGRIVECAKKDLTRKRSPIKSCGCLRNKYSDSIKIAKSVNRSRTQVVSVKHLLFGKYVQECTVEQEKKLKEYFKSTDKVGYSFGEKEVISFVKSIYKGSVINNDRKTLSPLELDIYVPEKRFAIEYDGLYWHSSKIKDMNYHLEKTRACAEKDVRLLHIYENEWRDKQDIVKSMIASALGVYEKKYFARNLTVKEVPDKKEVIDFFNENHIQGAVNRFSLCLGLYNKEEFIQAVVFGKQHFGRNGDMELYRMVTKKNTQVVGGFSRLMKNCPYDTVVSYVALRLFDAKGYRASGWKIEHQAKPSFCVTDFVDVYSRHLFKKSECLKLFDNVIPNMTETEMCERNGLYKIWDCGTYKVRWNRY